MTLRDHDPLTLLLADDTVEPPRHVDTAVRRRIRRAPALAATPPRLALAGGLSAAGFLALLAATAIGLAATGAAEAGPLLAGAAGLAWLALGATASLPLVFLHRPTAAPRVAP